MRPRKRHQMRHLFDFACFLAKQVLSRLSYTPTVGTTFNSRAFAVVPKIESSFFSLLD